MELEGLWLNSQEPIISPYSEPDAFNPQLSTQFS
jgi:hypothetical protein